MERREALHGEEGLVSTVAVEPRPRRAIGRRVPLPTEALTLTELGQPVLAIVVHGDPAPQGSKDARVIYTGGKARVQMYEAHKGVKPWRALVLKEALVARPAGWDVLDGPLVADMVFTLPKPKSAPKTLRTLPDKLPDLDKLARCTGDALGEDAKTLGCPLIADDCRIVAYRRLDKVYAGDSLDPDALRQPGAVIRLWRYPGHLLGKVERG